MAVPLGEGPGGEGKYRRIYASVLICPPSLNSIGEMVGHDKAVAHPTLTS